MSWPMVRGATINDEVKAMYAYLHSLLAVMVPRGERATTRNPL
jgi:hypothetical protein